MRYLLVLLFCASCMAKAPIRVQISATHSVTHEDRGARAIADKAMMGANSPSKQSESFNLDAIINGEHVFLACDDPKGCEAPRLDTYDGELKRNKWIRISFLLPVSGQRVTRWYKIAGSW